MRYPWATAGPGRATNGQPTLQTSSNRRYSNRLARTPVTNVVNLSGKISVFGEKALGLTTFVTPGQKSTQKTPWIDDVCNNTHQATRQRHSAAGVKGAGGTGGLGYGGRGRRRGLRDLDSTASGAGVEGAGGTGGHGCGARGRRRGLAGLRGAAPVRAAEPEQAHTPQAPPDWRPPRGLRGLAGLRADAPSEARGADGERAGRPRGGRRSGGQAARRPEIGRAGRAAAGDLSGQQAAPPEHSRKETPTAPGTP